MASPSNNSMNANTAVTLSIRLALIGGGIFLSVYIMTPFLGLLLWGLILAVTLQPLHNKLRTKLGGSSGKASWVFSITALLAIGVPVVLLTLSFVDYATETYHTMHEGVIEVPAPKASVAEWPLVGERIYTVWSDLHENPQETLQRFQPQIKDFGLKMAKSAGGAVTSVLLFLVAFIVASVMMAYGEAGAASMQRGMIAIAGKERGCKIQTLATATVRSVAMGVVGVAFIQALLLGVGFMFAGIPAAGLLALLAMLLGILQLPALLISIPAIALLWQIGDSQVMNTVWTVYLLVAGAADNVLKPILLGRGVDAPMPVILLGALGGMVGMGLIGLFAGAVVLAVCYELLMAWIEEGHVEAHAADEEPAG